MAQKTPETKNIRPDQPTQPAADAPPALSPEARDYLAFQVFEAAKSKFLNWGKWVLGIGAAMATLLGLRAWSDYKEALQTLDKKIESRLEETLEKKAKRIQELEKNMADQYVESVVRAK